MNLIRNSSPVSILFVEDDRETKDVLSGMIARKFPEVVVHVAENGKSGVSLCVERSPDIVITDINMPVMDGILMAEKIRSLKPDMKFIILTGYSKKMFHDKIESLGINEYMIKPVDVKALFNTIAKYIDQIFQERNTNRH